ncbi:MAG TPA: ABC transporter ATP-binding protein [Holophaga sp.]|nr:ABC transporter ATP-binding protein [Holophaga sp.]HPS66904.1 ABC transporter ATP-binding protein [Holophaga sp.]
MAERLLEVKNLTTDFHTFRGRVRAVDGISFHLDKGEVLGIVGESGSGKSVANLSILRLIEQPGVVSSDGVLFKGRDLSGLDARSMLKIRGKEISMIFQDPMTSLNPLYTIGSQIEEMLLLHTDLDDKGRKARCAELLAMVGITNPEERLRSYPHQFSGGMRQRVVIAIALAADPCLIIADEPTTALDVTIQAQILRLMERLVSRAGASMILITHDLAVVSRMAHRIAVMYCGRIVETGPKRMVIKSPAHPYTRGLLGSIPRMSADQRRLDPITGMVPSLLDLPSGCAFSPRCPRSQPICERGVPPEIKLDGGRSVCCHFPQLENL